MKKLLSLLCAMCLILTSCTYEDDGLKSGDGAELGNTSDTETTSGTGINDETEISSDLKASTEPEDAPEQETAADTAVDGSAPDDTSGSSSPELSEHKPATGIAGGHFSHSDSGLAADLGKYSKSAKLLTADDIYLSSVHCGYISDITYKNLIIETEQQLSSVSSVYLELLGEITEKYPISDYSYVVEYVEVGSGGYDLKAGALLVDTDRLSFVQSEDSITPDTFSIQTAVMDGFCYMAALPKGTLMNENYENWTYPESNAY